MSAGTGRPCSICTHPDGAEIERRVMAAEPLRKIATQYGSTAQSLMRHRDGHMTKAISGAMQREQQQQVEERRGDDLLDQIRVQQKAAAEILHRAYSANDLRTALSAVREGLRAIELMGRFLGHVQAPTVNILVSAEFKTVQIALLGALEQFPDAKRAVLTALEGVAE